MAISITINNKTFNIPVAGEDPGWGEDTTGWIREVSAVLNSLVGAGDILESNANIANAQGAPQNIVGLSFDPSTVRAAVVEYSVYRISDTNASGNAETGVIYMVYDNSAAPGSQWTLSRDFEGDAGIGIDIADTGQLTYTSDDIGNAGYSGTMTFKARTLSQ